MKSADVYTSYLVDCPYCVTENDVEFDPDDPGGRDPVMKCDHCGEEFGLDFSEVT